MTTKHTPGPWRIEHCNCGYERCDRWQPGPGHFYQGTGYGLPDARLIAAAPDLLAALEACLAVFPGPLQTLSPEQLAARQFAATAVAKATSV